MWAALQNCVRNTAWRRRKQTQNCAALPYLSTRADIFKRVNHRNLRCSALRGLYCLRLNVRFTLILTRTYPCALYSAVSFSHLPLAILTCHSGRVAGRDSDVTAGMLTRGSWQKAYPLRFIVVCPCGTSRMSLLGRLHHRLALLVVTRLRQVTFTPHGEVRRRSLEPRPPE